MNLVVDHSNLQRLQNEERDKNLNYKLKNLSRRAKKYGLKINSPLIPRSLSKQDKQRKINAVVAKTLKKIAKLTKGSKKDKIRA